jgi:hypothetical protein
MHDLSVLLSSLGAKRQDPAEPVWDIRAPGLFQSILRPRRRATFDAARRELLQAAIWERHTQNLVTDASEVSKVAGVVSSSRDGEYLLRPDVDVEALDKMALYYGGWYLYASSVVEPPPELLQALQAADVFRTWPRELVELLNRFHVHFLIASFYDDNEWRLAAPVMISSEMQPNKRMQLAAPQV